MSHVIITISREYGSGGRLIAQKLAGDLGIPFLDRQIISEAARTSGLPEDVIRKTENQKPFTNAFYEMFSYYATTNNQSVSEQVFLAESKVITDAADKGSCVIVGRCANYVLKGRKSCLSVFIHAPKNDRIRRAHDVYGIKSQNLEAYVTRQDKSRALFIIILPKINGATANLTTYVSTAPSALTPALKSSKPPRST